MNASELHRKLIYSGYSDLSDYLKDSPLNRYLYQHLLDMKNERRLDNPILTVFNEIYYQCTRVQYDSKPGEDIQKRYIDESSRWLRSDGDASLVFDIVWVMYAIRGVTCFEEECFYTHLTPLIDHNKDGFCDRLCTVLRSLGLNPPTSFKPMPASVSEIADGSRNASDSFTILSRLLYGEDQIKNVWRTVTADFSHKSIEQTVYLYTSPADRLVILSLIHDACNSKKHIPFFNELRQKIEHEVRTPRESPDRYTDDGVDYTIHDDDETETLLRKCQRLQEVCDDYVVQLESMQNYYLDKLYKMEEEHKAETVALMAQLDEALRKQSTAQDGDTQMEKPSLTIDNMIEYVKEKFSKEGAEDFRDMYWHFVGTERLHFDSSYAQLMDEIKDAVNSRTALHQTFELPHVRQFNNNPQTVINHSSPDEVNQLQAESGS